MDFATHIPIILPVRISDRISLSCRIWGRDVNRPTANIQIRYSIDELGAYPSGWESDGLSWGIPAKLITTVCPTPNEFLGGITAARGYRIPIYSNRPIAATRCVLKDMDLTYPLYAIPDKRRILRGG